MATFLSKLRNGLSCQWDHNLKQKGFIAHYCGVTFLGDTAHVGVLRNPEGLEKHLSYYRS